MDVAHHPGAVPGDATVDALATGLTHEDAGDLDRAGAAYRDALRTAPDDPGLLRALARVLARQGRLRIAAAKLRRCVEIAPDDVLAQRDLIDVLRYLDDTDAALAVVDGVLARHPDLPGALTKRGMVLLSRGDVADALGAFDHAVALTEGDANADAETVGTAVLNRAFARLAAGDLAGGWDDYEAGFAAEVRSLRRTDRPRWDGAPLAPATTLLVWREQGVGDDVLFLSCLADALTAAGPDGTVCAEVDPRLVSLVRRSFPASPTLEVVAARPDGTFPPHDLHCPLGSLPRLFRTTLDDFADPATSTPPGSGGFFVPDADAVARWRTRLGDGPNVGITWRSGLVTAERRLDFSRIDDWEPVLRAPDVQIVDVQYDGGRDELTPIASRLGTQVCEPAELDANGIDLRNDLDDLAALCAALDLVIGCANATTALAAAVGTAVWEPAPVTDPWRLGTQRSPFLPAKRIYARRHGEVWADVLARIGADLAVQQW